MIKNMATLRLFKQKRGTSAIEFALLAPVLLMIICGTIDMGYIYLAQTSLTGAVARAARSSAATQETTQADRDTEMRTLITRSMRQFTVVPGKSLSISSRVYNDFGSAKPESYTDSNANGRYDPPSSDYVGDPFTDRNGNGIWDSDTPIVGTTGDVGDVVRYTATFPVKHPFGFLIGVIWQGEGIDLSATSVVRNEPVKTE